jgi:hypothetical protein
MKLRSTDYSTTDWRAEMHCRSAGSGDRELFADFCSAQELVEVVVEFFLGDRRHSGIVMFCLRVCCRPLSG